MFPFRIIYFFFLLFYLCSKLRSLFLVFKVFKILISLIFPIFTCNYSFIFFSYHSLRLVYHYHLYVTSWFIYFIMYFILHKHSPFIDYFNSITSSSFPSFFTSLLFLLFFLLLLFLLLLLLPPLDPRRRQGMSVAIKESVSQALIDGASKLLFTLLPLTRNI